MGADLRNAVELGEDGRRMEDGDTVGDSPDSATHGVPQDAPHSYLPRGLARAVGAALAGSSGQKWRG